MPATVPRYHVLTSEMEAFVHQAIALQVPTIIDGPTGTGKNVLAGLVHFQGPRQAGPYVEVGCANLEPSLADGLLFGGRKGTWTGLHEDRDGFVKQADTGTFIMNDVDALSWEVQGKLLDFLDTGRYRRVGAKEDRRADVRTIVTTNRAPEQLVAEGKLRTDLYGRLAALRFTCPKLEQRRDLREVTQVVLLNVWGDLVRANGGATSWPGRPSLTPEAVDAIEEHDCWPTGFRGLVSVLMECIAAAKGGRIDAKCVRRILAERGHQWQKLGTDGLAPSREPYRRRGTREQERRKIGAALRRTRGNVAKAARELGMARSTLNTKLNEYRIRRWEFRDPPHEPKG